MAKVHDYNPFLRLLFSPGVSLHAVQSSTRQKDPGPVFDEQSALGRWTWGGETTLLP